jgi:hypothetical protein
MLARNVAIVGVGSLRLRTFGPNPPVAPPGNSAPPVTYFQSLLVFEEADRR